MVIMALIVFAIIGMVSFGAVVFVAVWCVVDGWKERHDKR